MAGEARRRPRVRLLAGLLPLALLALTATPSGSASRAGSSPAGRAHPGALRSAAGEPRYPSVPRSSIAKDSRIDIVIRGERVPLRNGGRIDLGQGLAVEVFLDPYPPTRLRAWLDLHLTRGAKARPVTDAVTAMVYDMRYMSHGPFKARAKNLRDGHYLFTLTYIMYGAWDQLVTIQVGRRSYELPVVLIAMPS